MPSPRTTNTKKSNPPTVVSTKKVGEIEVKPPVPLKSSSKRARVESESEGGSDSSDSDITDADIPAQGPTPAFDEDDLMLMMPPLPINEIIDTDMEDETINQKTPTPKRKAKKARRVTSGEESVPASSASSQTSKTTASSASSQVSKASSPSTSSQISKGKTPVKPKVPEPPKVDGTKTITEGKSKGKGKERKPIPSFLANSDALKVERKAEWRWAPAGVPDGNYDIPDILGKEVNRDDQPGLVMKYLEPHIKLYEENHYKTAVWACQLFKFTEVKTRTTAEAIKTVLGNDYKVVAPPPGSIWSLVLSTKEAKIEDVLIGKALLNQTAGRAIIFRSIKFPTYRFFKIEEVRL
jgi:hypothetical protein